MSVTHTTVVMDRSSVVSTLFQLLRTDRFMDFKTRFALAHAIGSMGPDVAPVLLEALGDENESVQQCANSALRVLSRQCGERLPALKDALSHPKESVRLGAALVMLQSQSLSVTVEV